MPGAYTKVADPPQVGVLPALAQCFALWCFSNSRKNCMGVALEGTSRMTVLGIIPYSVHLCKLILKSLPQGLIILHFVALWALERTTNTLGIRWNIYSWRNTNIIIKKNKGGMKSLEWHKMKMRVLRIMLKYSTIIYTEKGRKIWPLKHDVPCYWEDSKTIIFNFWTWRVEEMSLNNPTILSWSHVEDILGVL